jgi:uncharacterized HAD superfamily protein
MKKSINQLGLAKIANVQVNRLEQFDKLKEIANRNNYPHKVKQLTAKITEEYSFWNLKNPSRKLEDITKDLIFIKSIKDPNSSKDRIDILIEKYGLK